jgi:hypothetical protein
MRCAEMSRLMYARKRASQGTLSTGVRSAKARKMDSQQASDIGASSDGCVCI